MEQRSVLSQTTRPQAKQTRLTYQWMHYFFTEDVSPDKRSLVDLQRRASWIGLALVLQTLNEIDHIPSFTPFIALLPFALMVGSFFAIWMAFRPASAPRTQQQALHATTRPASWQRIVLLLTLMCTVGGAILLGRGIALSISAPQFTNDGTSLDTNAAILLLQGRNPYSDSSLLELARHFAIQPDWTTPLRRGQFANQRDYPNTAEFRSVLDTSFKAGNAPEFEAKVSYPALSFLTLVPFVIFGDNNVLPFYILSYLAIIALAWKVTRPALRPWVLVLALADVPMWAAAIGGSLDIFYILLVIVAWLLRDRRWSSALFLGLAIASKQIAWYFVPFYFIMIWRQQSLKEAIYRTGIAGILGLAINLPFILWNPHAWLTGILAPVADPMFPMGVGIVSLSVAHLLPYMPQWIYTALEAGAMLLMLVWYWRICRKHPEAALLLAVIPLFFAWRSLLSYFYCAAFPLFILQAARAKPKLLPVTSITTIQSNKPPVAIGTGAGA